MREQLLKTTASIAASRWARLRRFTLADADWVTWNPSEQLSRMKLLACEVTWLGLIQLRVGIGLGRCVLTTSAWILFGYLVGSLPTSVLVARRSGLDIRDHGSGNAGATNVFRVVGWKPALLVLLVDVAKGWFAVALAAWFADQLQLVPWVGLAAIVGHVWPLFAAFRGGKGVATAAGVMLALAPWAAVGSLVLFVLGLGATRRVAVGSLLGAVAFPVLLKMVDRTAADIADDGLLWVAVLVALLIVWSHRSNLANLLAGREPAIWGR